MTVALLGATSGCSDDDDPTPGSRDAGSKDAGGRDSGGGGSIELDATLPAKDAGPDASTDHDAGFQCKSEPVPHWDPEFRWPTRATRVPLNVYCNSGCPSSLQAYLQSLTCEVLDDAGIQDIAMGVDVSDGGNPNDLVLRSDGCGTVQFTTVHPGWPRDFNFDAMTGKLIGAARLDDIGTPVQGIPCESAAWIAGEFRASCPAEVLKLCTFH